MFKQKELKIIFDNYQITSIVLCRRDLTKNYLTIHYTLIYVLQI